MSAQSHTHARRWSGTGWPSARTATATSGATASAPSSAPAPPSSNRPAPALSRVWWAGRTGKAGRGGLVLVRVDACHADSRTACAGSFRACPAPCRRVTSLAYPRSAAARAAAGTDGAAAGLGPLHPSFKVEGRSVAAALCLQCVQTNCKHFYSFLGPHIHSCGGRSPPLCSNRGS